MGAGAILNHAVMQFWAVGGDDRAFRVIGKACVEASHICHQHQQVGPQLPGKQPCQAAYSHKCIRDYCQSVNEVGAKQVATMYIIDQFAGMSDKLRDNWSL